MIRFHSTRFGILEVEEDKIITFPDGIPGFHDLKRYILMDYKDTPFKWLQSVDEPSLAFIVTTPETFSVDYSQKIDQASRERLKLKRKEDLAIFLIVRVEDGKVIPNFNGPIFINADNMTGLQAVLERV